MCVFSYVAAGSDHKKSPLMQHKHAQAQPQIQHHQQQQLQQAPTSKVQQIHLPQQTTNKLQTIISKPGPTSPKPVQVPLKQANQPVPVHAEAVQPPQKLPNIPARKPSIPSSTSPLSSDPPKVKPPQLSEAVKRTQSVTTPRGPPPPIPVRSGSVQHPNIAVEPKRPVRRQSTINSSMPSCTPQPPPEFYIPQRRGSITRQQSSSSVTSPKLSK